MARRVAGAGDRARPMMIMYDEPPVHRSGPDLDGRGGAFIRPSSTMPHDTSISWFRTMSLRPSQIADLIYVIPAAGD